MKKPKRQRQKRQPKQRPGSVEVFVPLDLIRAAMSDEVPEADDEAAPIWAEMFRAWRCHEPLTPAAIAGAVLAAEDCPPSDGEYAEKHERYSAIAVTEIEDLRSFLEGDPDDEPEREYSSPEEQAEAEARTRIRKALRGPIMRSRPAA